jgi:hypothetical protein
MNKAEMQTWTLHKLGAPFNKVEISQENLDFCFEEAVRWYSAKKGHKDKKNFQIVPGQVEYTLDDDVDTVLQITFTSQSTDYSYLVDPLNLIGGQIPTSMFGYGNQAGGDTGGFLSTYAQFTQYLGMARRILNSDSEWLQLNSKLIIVPPPKSGGPALMEYKAHSFTVEQINEFDHDLVKRMLLALVKDFVGRVRSRFDNFPSAQGTVTIDGPKLLQESIEERDKLNEEIFESNFPIGFLHG